MEASDRHYVLSKINELAQRRHQHERIIEKLLANEQPSTVRSMQSSHAPRIPATRQPLGPMQQPQQGPMQPAHQATDNQGGQTARSNLTTTSSLSRQVNLDVHLQNSRRMPRQQPEQLGGNLLYDSLVDRFGHNARFSICPIDEIAKKLNQVNCHELAGLGIVGKFLQENQLWAEVFSCNNNKYYAYLYPEMSNMRELAYLSGEKLHNRQIPLIAQSEEIGECVEFLEDAQSENLQSTRVVYIGYLLLYRLFNYLRAGSAHQVLQCVFGFPYQTFNLHTTAQYFDCLGTVAKYPAESLMIMAQKRINSSLVELPANTLTQSALDLLKLYSSVTVVHAVQSLMSKQVAIVHRRNHHSVVDIENGEQFEVQLYLTMRDAGTQTAATSGPVYRYCLASESGEILQYSQQQHPGSQCIVFTIPPLAQCQLYLSQVPFPGCPDSCAFSLVCQSPHPLQNLTLELKFKQEYNTLTQALINSYLNNYANIDQVEREMIRISELKPEADVLVVRVGLGIMGLAVDFVSVRESLRARKHRLEVEYEGTEVLCDKNYRENKRRLDLGAPQIYQIYLSKRAAIKSCSGLSFAVSEIFL